MSLFGAMNTGVSGLASQSSAMAAIADNITNVNTIGYKSTTVDFQTLVTSQASNSTYSSGGVQSRPRTGVDVQGLMQSSTSANDLAIFGDGFFLVNETSEPGTGDQFLFSRAGSFSADDDGYLKNTGGYYLQAWPTDRSGNVVLPSGNTGLTNQNIISPQFLETVNLNRVGGTADETTSISIGANLPAKDSVGGTHDIDVQFFDTLGNTNAAAFRFSKTATNQWDLSVQPPADTAAVTLYDSAGQVYRSIGQLEFSANPAAGTSVDINGTTYTFGGAGNVTIGATIEETVANFITFVNANPPAGGLGDDVVAVHPGNAKAVMFTGGTNGGGVDLAIDASGCAGGAPALVADTSIHRRQAGHRHHSGDHLQRRRPAEDDRRQQDGGAGVRQRRRDDGRRHGITDLPRLRLDRRGRRDYPAQRRVHPQLHRAERRPLRCLQRRHHQLGRPGFGVVRQRRTPAHLPHPAGHLRQPRWTRRTFGQRLEHHRGLRQPDIADGGNRAGRQDRAVVPGSLDRRHRPGVHRHDRRSARLLGRHQDHQTADEMLDELVHLKR